MNCDDGSVLWIVPLTLEEGTANELKRNFHVIYRDILNFVNENPEQYPHLPRVRILLQNQARAIAAVKSFKKFVEFKSLVVRQFIIIR